MNAKHDDETVTITIDGRSYTMSDDDQDAAALLRLAGLEPALYDLAELGHGEPKVYRDEKHIHLKDGDAFVSVRQSAPVA